MGASESDVYKNEKSLSKAIVDIFTFYLLRSNNNMYPS